MITVSKSKLKARMLGYLRQVQATGEPLVATEYDRQVLTLAPCEGGGPTSVDALFADVRGGRAASEEALLAPTEGEWPQIGKDD